MISSTKTPLTPPAINTDASETIESSADVPGPVSPPSPARKCPVVRRLLEDTEISLPLVALKERGGESSALSRGKWWEVDEGDHDLSTGGAVDF